MRNKKNCGYNEKLRTFCKEFIDSLYGMYAGSNAKQNLVNELNEFISNLLAEERERIIEEILFTKNIAVCYRCRNIFKAKHDNCPKLKQQ